MKIKNVIVTHHAYIVPVTPCGILILGATSDGKLRGVIECSGETRDDDECHFVEYDMSNMIEGITYRHGEYTHEKIIEGAILKGDTIHIDIHDEEQDYVEYQITDLGKDFKYVSYDSDTPTFPDDLETTVFPPVETKAEWVDRMERILAHCAQNFEAAMGSLYLQNYTRLQDIATAKPSTNYLIRQTNTSVHCRWQIGWFWERVDRIKRNLPTVYTQAQLEPMIQAVYANMKTPQHIKQFFHRHNTEEWKKLRNQSSDTRQNKRHISAWASDYTEGTNFADLTARSTVGGHLNEQSADASMFEYGVTEYTKAAKHPNWELITERIY